VDINVDMGESYGRWQLGDDANVMPWITSANIACGFHAGDPGTMRSSTQLAVEHGVAIGAHVGFPDLLGFGRRRIDVTAGEVRDYATYQIGALQAIVSAEGGALAHVKPHGALYALCSRSDEHAAALSAAIADVDARLPLLLLSRHVAASVEAHGIRLVVEAFPDLDYEPEGDIIIEPIKRARDPDLVARRATRIVLHHTIETTNGGEIEVHAPTLCLHGDAPNAVETARTVRESLERAGVTVSPLAA
jgi:UPF0271 protein